MVLNICVCVCVNRYISRVVPACIICVAIVTAHENPHSIILFYFIISFFFRLKNSIRTTRNIIILCTADVYIYNTSSSTTYNYIRGSDVIAAAYLISRFIISKNDAPDNNLHRRGLGIKLIIILLYDMYV